VRIANNHVVEDRHHQVHLRLGARRHSPGRVCLMTSGRRRDERGFTLVELMLSLMLFTVGILSLSATSAVVVSMMGGARQQTIAATMAQSRLERLRGLACSAPAFTGGSAAARGIAGVWRVAALAIPDTASTPWL